MARQIIERVNVLRGAPMNIGGRTVFSKELPVGEGWHRLNMKFSFTVTIGTGTGPRAGTGLLQIIRNVLLRTDRGEQPCNAPGHLLYFINWINSGVTPQVSTLAAANGTYDVYLSIPFVGKRLARPNDTILDTARYNTVSLDINLGNVADLYTTPGTATVTCALDLSLVRTRGILPEEARPRYYVEYNFRQPVDAATTTSIDLERSPDLSYQRLYLNTMSSGTAGLPFYGTPANTIISRSTLKDQSSFIVNDEVFNSVRAANAQTFALTQNPDGINGLNVFSFIDADGSVQSSLFSGDKSILQHTWVNDTAPANSIVTMGTEGIRLLK